MLKTVTTLLSGPVGGMLEKGCLAFAMYAAGKGWLPMADAAGIAAALYTLISAGITGFVNTQTAKVQSINEADNGVKVVPVAAPGQPVDGPLK